jgi:LysR family transcriptional regulator (chromosome initiation inhibitor)
VTRSALLKAPVVAFDHLDDMHQAFLQQNFDLPPGSVPCHIVNSSKPLCSWRARARPAA